MQSPAASPPSNQPTHLLQRKSVWAGCLPQWKGPAEGERPTAYIVILGDNEISRNVGCDHGIAAQSIMLGTTEQGLGGCMIGAIDRQGLRETLEIPERYEILLVLALGKPAEMVVLENVGPDGSIKYADLARPNRTR